MKNSLLVCVIIYVALCSPFSKAQFSGAGQKIAVIDSGIMNNDSLNLPNVVKQICASQNNSIADDSTNATDGFVHYDIASTCPFGATNSTSSNAATVPRFTEHNFAAVYDYHRFASPHGSYVTDQVRLTSPSVGIVAANISYYSADAEISPNDSVHNTCSYHSASDVLADVPENAGFRYPRKNPFSDAVLMNQIVSSGSVAAINISLGANLSCNTSSSQIASIVNSEIGRAHV